jgi:hypothetical protein
MKFVTLFFMVLSINGFAQVQREINGESFYLHDDFDTADGECVLRGHTWAKSFYSFNYKKFPVAKLHLDGGIMELITSGSEDLPIIENLECE